MDIRTLINMDAVSAIDWLTCNFNDYEIVSKDDAENLPILKQSVSNLCRFCGNSGRLTADQSMSCDVCENGLMWCEPPAAEPRERYLFQKERAQLLLSACKDAYRKHVADDPDIGWNELTDKLTDALSEVMGADAFVEWSDKL